MQHTLGLPSFEDALTTVLDAYRPDWRNKDNSDSGFLVAAYLIDCINDFQLDKVKRAEFITKFGGISGVRG